MSDTHEKRKSSAANGNVADGSENISGENEALPAAIRKIAFAILRSAPAISNVSPADESSSGAGF